MTVSPYDGWLRGYGGSYDGYLFPPGPFSPGGTVYIDVSGGASASARAGAAASPVVNARGGARASVSLSGRASIERRGSGGARASLATGAGVTGEVRARGGIAAQARAGASFRLRIDALGGARAGTSVGGSAQQVAVRSGGASTTARAGSSVRVTTHGQGGATLRGRAGGEWTVAFVPSLEEPLAAVIVEPARASEPIAVSGEAHPAARVDSSASEGPSSGVIVDMAGADIEWRDPTTATTLGQRAQSDPQETQGSAIMPGRRDDVEWQPNDAEVT